MKKLIAYCGIDCSKCPAYIATQKDDQEGLVKTAADWSARFNVDVKPSDVICDGCTTESPKKASYCNMCEIRKCARDKVIKTCASCGEYICEKLEKFFQQAPEAKANLEKIQNR
ncbi:MAG: DUF3795 domain-containing protein [Candidatus Cloacimonetes bacterium]|nr:DUF3795 domain-containing protein [Candidatus Cloacimonadota bacterium]